MRHADERIQRHTAAPEALVSYSAQLILDTQAALAPDLSGCTVLLPHLHLAAPLAQATALAQSLSAPAQSSSPLARSAPAHSSSPLASVRSVDKQSLLLPRLTTLAEFARGIALSAPIVSHSRRLALVYEALREHTWLGRAADWPLCREIVAVADELTLERVGVASDGQEFADRVRTALHSRAVQGGCAALDLEARLLFDLWRALVGADLANIDPALAYVAQLERAAAGASGPLFVLHPGYLTRAERDFLAAYSERQSVHVIECALGASDQPLARVLLAAWPELNTRRPEENDPPPTPSVALRERAQQLVSGEPGASASGRVAFYAAHSLDQLAQAASTQVRHWLACGKRHIALLAQDRLLARRVRAMLERARILVADESGWRLSTTAASTIVMRWLDLVRDDFYHRDLLDALKSPFMLADWAPARRKRAVSALQDWIGVANYVAGARALERLSAQRSSPDCAALVAQLARAAALLQPNAKARRASLSEWLRRLLGSLDALAVTQGLARDSAGQEVLKLLVARRDELAGLDASYSFAEWREWLDAEFESARFRDSAIESPVVLTQLSLAQLRNFDALVVLGADAQHLLPQAHSGALINEAVRRSLGLPGAQQRTREAQERLAQLCLLSGEVLFVWQDMAGGGAPLHGSLTRLRTLHRLAFGDDLTHRQQGDRDVEAPAPGLTSALPRTPALRPTPILPRNLLPRQISVSAYASLIACPYQFYARHALALNEQDRVREAPEKRDYGEQVHNILRVFHEEFAQLSGIDRSDLEAALLRHTRAAFAGWEAFNPVTRAWRLRWEKLMPRYLDWQLERESGGWRWSLGEASRALTIALADDVALQLRGRLDRVDVRPGPAGEEHAVLDYKTQARAPLAERLKQPGEDVQLGIYTLLFGASVHAASYLSLDTEVSEIPLDQPQQWAALERARVGEIFSALAEGAALPAQGVARVCERCEMRGLCRRDLWGS